MGGAMRGVQYLFDRRTGVGDRLIGRWVFLRALGGIYLAAFLALVFQARGLVGERGILPGGEYLQALRGLGWLRFWYAPSLQWISRGDVMLMAVVWVGLVASVLVMLNLAPRAMLLVCFICFLSWIGVSQDFGDYQSDGMLLEAGFLALFLVPAGWRPGWGRSSLPSRAAVFLLLWEWFRIYFESGVVKLESGDPTWRNLTAMYEYYQNGPLPTWVGWYLEQLPHWFQRDMAGLTLAMELVLVWMAFVPRRGVRIVCFLVVTVWQVGVIATANYAFLNYLVLVLAILLLDDATLVRFVPRRWREGLGGAADGGLRREGVDEVAVAGQRLSWGHGVWLAGTAVCLGWVGYVTTAELAEMFAPRLPLPKWPVVALEPLRIANRYGLFATMTPHRYEIEFQGSRDGARWTAYQFRFKPQAVDERPRIYAPYQPRFDWNLWFASLSTWREQPIVPLTEERLLEGDREVLHLFRGDPFVGRPPRYVRAVIYQYWFSTPEQKRRTGAWWRREMLGTYAPTLEKAADGRYGMVSAADWAGPQP